MTPNEFHSLVQRYCKVSDGEQQSMICISYDHQNKEMMAARVGEDLDISTALADAMMVCNESRIIILTGVAEYFMQFPDAQKAFFDAIENTKLIGKAKNLFQDE